MHKDENNAIRYLLREMDPSEEMEFEQQMREDEDLLIEVESLRATKRKLSGLPSKNPPKFLTQKISDDVKQIQKNKKSPISDSLKYFFNRGVAAAILLIAVTGGISYYAFNIDQNSPLKTNVETQIQPWVDRNEVLRFQDESQSIQAQDIQQDLTRSYEKLQLVNDQALRNGSNGILLTGSSN
jgi:hypothetical protein